MPIQAYPDALKAAQTADTPEEFKAVMDEVTERLDRGGHAIAIDSASSILKALSERFASLYMAPANG